VRASRPPLRRSPSRVCRVRRQPDRGNLAIAIGADPTQTITGNSYIPSKPYASNQFSNGDVWVKSFADALGLASFALPALAGGGDFAFGGARVATDGAGLPPSLSAQETQFLSSTGGSAPPGALYVVAGGGNDARDAYRRGIVGNPLATIASLRRYAQATGVLVDRPPAGGRRPAHHRRGRRTSAPPRP
jgi:outer membrane lipase/esterase